MPLIFGFGYCPWKSFGIYDDGEGGGSGNGYFGYGSGINGYRMRPINVHVAIGGIEF